MLHFAAPTTLRHPPPRRDVTACCVAPDQSVLATGLEDGTISTWEVSTGVLLTTFPKGHTGRINGLSYNKDAAVLSSVGEDGQLIWWMLNLEEEDEGHHTTASAITSNTKGGADAHAAAATPKIVKRVLPGHGGAAITCCLFAPQAQIMASGSKENDVIVWGNLGRSIHGRMRAHTNWVTCLAFHPNATILASGSHDHSIVIWDIVHFGVIRYLRFHEMVVTSLAISVEGSVLASGDAAGKILLSRLSDGVCLRAMKGHEDDVTGIGFVENLGLVVSASRDTTVKVWELRGTCVKSFQAHSGAVTALSISQLDEMIVTSGEDGCTRVFPYVWKDE